MSFERPLSVGVADGWMLLALSGLVLFLYWPLWTTDPISQAALAPGDLTVYYYPLTAYTIRQLQEGHLPLWNPYVLGGFPHLAELQTQALYPVQGLIALMSLGQPLSYRAFAATVILHLILTAWGAYGFFRWLVRDRAAATFGAVAWSCSGYLTGYPLQAPPILASATWLPWLLWMMGRALMGRRFRRRNGFLSAWIWALVFLGGFPQVAAYVYGITLAFGAVCLLSLPPGERKPSLPTALIIVTCGTALSAAQLLPSLEAASLSERLTWPFRQRAQGFEIWDLFGTIWPHLAYWSPLYVGIPVLMTGFILGNSRQAGPTQPGLWIGVGIAGILLSLGGESALYPVLIRLVPGWGIFRNQERAAMVVAWALITLGTLRWKGNVIPARLRLTGIGLGIAGLMLIGLFLWIQAQPLSEIPRLHRWLSYAMWPWLIGGASWLLLRGWPQTRWWLIGLLVLDVGSVAWRTAAQVHLVWQPPNQVAAPPLSIESIPEALRGYRIDTRGHWTGNWPALVGIEDLHGDLTFITRFFHRFREKVPGERVWALMGVGCYIWKEGESRIPFSSHRVASLPGREGPLYFECLEDPFPRYRLVYESVAFDDETAIRALQDGEFDPLRVVILDRPWTFPVSVTLPLSPTIQLLSRRPEEVWLRIQIPRSGFLIVGDPWYPGWRAKVDGHPVPVLRAYTALRAIPLTAGDHTVQLYYRPKLFYAGLAISGFFLAVMIIWGLGFLNKQAALI